MGFYSKVRAMVLIPQQQDKDPTLEALRRLTVAQGKGEGRRTYVGASGIGKQCSRAIWYDYNGYPRKEKPAELKWAADCGHRSEAIMADWLRSVPGVDLQTTDTTGKQFGFEALGGRFRGHIDGIITGLLHAPKTVAVWEHKSKNQKGFNAFQTAKEKFGTKRMLKEWDEIYFVQAQVYMHFMHLDRHYLTISLGGMRDIDSCWTEYQPEVALAAIDKAEKVIYSTMEPPRISNQPDFFACRFCDFAEICHKPSNKGFL